jgi:hypothetical protein
VSNLTSIDYAKGTGATLPASVRQGSSHLHACEQTL